MDAKQFGIYLIQSLFNVAATNIFVQSGSNQWKLAQGIPGLEPLTSKTFNSRDEIVQVVVDHLYSSYEKNPNANVTGLRSSEQAQTTRKAV